ncbi:ankyrin repeat domain-containing protein SOWAHB isoform X3 [Myzus persicae]|uniref:ankyrin repeat domain-containing protein SOWAHB isoform X3 n=1 Tax=Myzus persicae TaxID=13164 RepID=UPI000B93029F|nr:ankyrin repeat domain-containing protein SOWAHB isoform X3 [Myzus persicae]
MAVPNELSLESVRDFMIMNDGRVTNHDLVTHFKYFLTNPQNRAEARHQFKEIVNTVATVICGEDGEKYLMLKRRFRVAGCIGLSLEPSMSTASSLTSLTSYPGLSSVHHSLSQDSLIDPPRFQQRSPMVSPSARQPPPYRPPPSPIASPKECSPTKEAAPPVPPRRRSSEKIKLIELSDNVIVNSKDNYKENDQPQQPQISVKDRTQKFNRIASENALHLASQLPSPNKKKIDKNDKDDEDTISMTSLDPKTKEWVVKSAKCDYQALAKLASENPRIAKFKDPITYTALHWAAKHGNMDLVKMLAGTYNANVNAKTNGGYTPCHLALQFGHEEIYKILVESYGADPNVRDYSGRKPRQYQTNQDTSLSADTYRKLNARKHKHMEKDLRFLRIGSLNVRVKRTTEAFSNFLGVGHNAEKIHKTWGSADNIQQQNDAKRMPPPKSVTIKKRKSKRPQDFLRRASAPADRSPDKRKSAEIVVTGDSDSDTACGFGTNWQPS